MHFIMLPIFGISVFVGMFILSDKYPEFGDIINIFANIAALTFPLTWILGFVMIAYTYNPIEGTYNGIWHVFPFAAVFIFFIVVCLDKKYNN